MAISQDVNLEPCKDFKWLCSKAWCRRIFLECKNRCRKTANNRTSSKKYLRVDIYFLVLDFLIYQMHSFVLKWDMGTDFVPIDHITYVWSSGAHTAWSINRLMYSTTIRSNVSFTVWPGIARCQRLKIITACLFV